MMEFCINNGVEGRASRETSLCGIFVISRATLQTTHGCRSPHENTVRRQLASVSIEKTGTKHYRTLHTCTPAGVCAKRRTHQVIIGIGVG